MRPLLSLSPSASWSEYRQHRERLDNEVAAGWLTLGEWAALVAIAILYEAGDVDPTVAKIAVCAHGVSKATVRRALRKGVERGLLRVIRQFSPPIPGGGRPQLANRYEPLLPEGVVRPKPKKPRTSPPKQTARPNGSKKEKELRKGWFPGVKYGDSVDNSLLLARRVAIQAQMAARYTGRY